VTNLPLEIDDLALSTEEATETLRAIRSGHIDGVVVNAPSGHVVLTFQNPDHVYRSLVEAMGDGAALVTSEGVISYHNPRFAELVADSSVTRLAGRALRDLVTADAAVSVDSMLERGQRGPVRMEVGMRPPAGSALMIQLTASPARLADIPVLCVIATDLTDQRAQAELYRNALIGMGERERLISSAGQKLRAPIQALVFELGIVLDRVRTAAVSADPETTTRLAAIQDQALQLAQLVGNLLDVELLAAPRSGSGE
jgi:PAS domain S-box-containing protein